jgi:hypothetical protein
MPSPRSRAFTMESKIVLTIASAFPAGSFNVSDIFSMSSD